MTWQLGWKATKQDDVIRVFNQFIMLVGHALAGIKLLKLRPSWSCRTWSNTPNIVPTLQSTRSQVKAAGGKTTLFESGSAREKMKRQRKKNRKREDITGMLNRNRLVAYQNASR